jgi:hypothetical protein
MWTKDDTHEMSRPQSFHRRPLSFHLTEHQPVYCPAMSASTSIVVNLNYFLIGVEFMLLAAHVLKKKYFLILQHLRLTKSANWLDFPYSVVHLQSKRRLDKISLVDFKKFNSFSFSFNLASLLYSENQMSKVGLAWDLFIFLFMMFQLYYSPEGFHIKLYRSNKN